ncbi:ABC transporter permease [Nocardioides sp. zg-1228]|uniref:ABC transporter permease n=1 Tax=Nocardioides sp. zg-1228 TaxID=2763008 RepID=UPI0016424159|nr:ABC transporter permease [Nocardioides sp. zg-1228]MBC2934028.1 ABC transporter permease [Nocardioides sp. zg-1228]QSF58784.1 hypothetical protein JX575_06255 [Nocardioides sp. zg-1228]
MSTDTATTTPAVGDGSTGRPGDPTPLAGRPGVPFSRTLHAEVRKMVDTRAGRWMVIVMAALTVLILGAFVIWGPTDDASFTDLVQIAIQPLAMLLPVIGIMAATAEWSQRTGLVTFTLEPRRGRVVLAKALGALVLGLVVMAVAFAAAALANLASGGTWDLGAGAAGKLVLALLIFVLQGVAFGLLFLNTPVAIVTVLVLPTAWTIVTQVVGSLSGVGAWLDLNAVTRPLLSGDITARDWAQLGTGVGVWVLLPLAVGTWRVLAREVK